DRRLTKSIFVKEHDNWMEQPKIHYLYQGDMEIGSCDSNGNILELRVLGYGLQAVALELQNEVFMPVYDHVGHVIALYKDGKQYETYRYSAYGEEQIFNSKGLELAHSINPWRYAGKRTDNETGFVYYGKRYYDPETCQWLTPDPAGFVNGLNLYAFLLNN